MRRSATSSGLSISPTLGLTASPGSAFRPRRRVRAGDGTHRRTAAAHRVVARVAWVMLVGGLAVNQVAERASYRTGQAILLTMLSAFFVLLLIRLALAARLYRTRRVQLLVLLAAVAAWSLGSM